MFQWPEQQQLSWLLVSIYLMLQTGIDKIRIKFYSWKGEVIAVSTVSVRWDNWHYLNLGISSQFHKQNANVWIETSISVSLWGSEWIRVLQTMGFSKFLGENLSFQPNPVDLSICQISVVLDEMMENFESTQSSPKKFVKPSWDKTSYASTSSTLYCFEIIWNSRTVDVLSPWLYVPQTRHKPPV